jgi:acyl-CoA dehydrogenase
MTEPEVASSDNIETRIRGEGNDYVINGRKWWTSGALDPRCKVLIVMGQSDPDNPGRYRRQSMILVPLPHPGVLVKRMLAVFGYDEAPHGHAEGRSTVSGCRPPTYCSARAAVSRSPRGGSARAASTIACG